MQHGKVLLCRHARQSLHHHLTAHSSHAKLPVQSLGIPAGSHSIQASGSHTIQVSGTPQHQAATFLRLLASGDLPRQKGAVLSRVQQHQPSTAANTAAGAAMAVDTPGSLAMAGPPATAVRPALVLPQL